MGVGPPRAELGLGRERKEVNWSLFTGYLKNVGMEGVLPKLIKNSSPPSSVRKMFNLPCPQI